MNEKRIGNDTKRCEGETTLGMLIKTGYIFVILLLNFVKKKNHVLEKLIQYKLYDTVILLSAKANVFPTSL